MSNFSNEMPEITISRPADTVHANPDKKTNIPLGIIGSIAGSLLGVALWVIIDMVGFIAGISGVVMLTASLKGYQLLGGKLDRFGMIFSVILSFFMIFVAVNVTLLIAFVQELGMGMMNMVGIPNILISCWQDPDLLGYILKNLAIGYALYIWSGFSQIKSALTGTI